MNDRVASHQARPRLAPQRRIRVMPSHDCHLLVQPSGRVPLNPSAAAILALCDGRHTRQEIVDLTLRRFLDRGLAVDVHEFLDAARERGWIVEG